MGDVAALGIRSDLAMAAAFGAVFLIFYKHLTPRQAIGALFGGVGLAVYFTPIVARALHAYFTWFPSDALGERAVAFAAGVGGSYLLAGMIVLGERFKKDPVQTVREIKP
jgi:hypothetical protein